MQIKVTADQKKAIGRAATLLSRQADGLRETGSTTTVAAIERYLATLQKVSAAPGDVDLTPEEKVHLDQASFLLEGLRDSLLNADFRERASIIQDDVDQLGKLSVQFNTKASLA